MRYRHDEFPYVTPPPLAGTPEGRHPVVIAGAGPIGLAMAVDLALRAVPSVVLDGKNRVSIGSRAICWSKRSLEILDRLGVAGRMLEKGVTWKIGRTSHRGEEICSIDLLPHEGHKMPAFINLPQHYLEEFLVARCRDFPDLIDLRFRNRVIGVEQHQDHTVAQVDTPDGEYRIEAEYLLACDGAHSTIRSLLELEFTGEEFDERFLIVDIGMETDFPAERRFWFEPPFHPGQTALMHKQPDNIYRIDLQIGRDADLDEEGKPERVIPRIEKAVEGRGFSLDRVSVITFRCCRLERFLHGRVIFAGDSAHNMPTFGARGGNGGIQDVDNLGWKLAAVLNGEARANLLESYNHERIIGADENILHSTRTTRFMSPDDGVERLFRDAVLELAATAPFARKIVNSGRLSLPAHYKDSALNGPDADGLPAESAPGNPAPDAPLEAGWLLELFGDGFTLLGLNTKPPEHPGVISIRLEAGGPLAARYLGDAPSAVYLIRPDQHIAARWIEADTASAAAAFHTAMGA